MKDSVDSIITAIKPLAEKIGEGAAHLYEVYVRQMVAEGIGELITIAAFVILCIAIWIFTRKSWRRFEEKAESYDDPVIPVCFTAVACIISFFTLIAVLNITNSFTKITNPEYHAVQKILDTVKGK